MLRPLRAGLGQHRHPAEQQVRRLEALARADEGAQRAPTLARCPCGTGVAHRLLDQPEAAARSLYVIPFVPTSQRVRGA